MRPTQNTLVMVVVLAGLSAVTTSATAEPHASSPGVVATAVGAGVLPPPITIACQGAGASDVRHRNHQIKNTTAFAMPKGTTIHWTSSDKGAGSVTLATLLAPNGTIDVIEPGQTNGYSCGASFNPGEPDYVVKNLAWASPNHASVTMEVANVNPWVDAPKATLSLRTMKCLNKLVIGLDVYLDPIAKGGAKTFTMPFNGAGADYLEATINSDDKVPETNKTNNTARSIEFMQNKSCTPQ